MQIGLIGTGKMGAGIMRRLVTAGHEVVAYDPAAARKNIRSSGGIPVNSLKQLVAALNPPRTIWLMIPAAAVETTFATLLTQLAAKDCIVDGGNSYFKDSQDRAARAKQQRLQFIDVGVSGGVAGEERGYALMAGGSSSAIKKLQPIFAALAAPEAYLHTGEAGSGHFVKMVHNAIEYGMMQAIAEGFDLLQGGPVAIAPAAVAQLWSHGTIIRSFLMELAAKALARDEKLSAIAAYVEDNGEGRWATTTAVEQAVPFTVNTAALYARFDSRQPDAFAAKLVAALRQEFGGHTVKKKK